MEQSKSYPLGQPIPNPTIKVVTSETIHSPACSDQVTISVIRYNGHEYIANSKGGIIHSESCPCKTAVQEEK